MDKTFKKLQEIDRQLIAIQEERHLLIASVVGEGFDLYPYESHESIEYGKFRMDYRDWKKRTVGV